MSKWIERFLNHEIHDVIKSTGVLLDKIDSLEKSVEGAVDSFVRLRQVHTHAISVLSSVDPTLVPYQALDSLSTAFKPLNQELDNYCTNENVAHLDNANSHADSALQLLSVLNIPSSTEDIETIRESISNYKRSASQQVRRLEEESETLRTELLELLNKVKETTTEITSQKSRLDNAIAEYQKQFSESVNSWRSEFSGLIKESTVAYEQFQEKIASEIETLLVATNDKLKVARDLDDSRAKSQDAQLMFLREETKEELNKIIDEKSETFLQLQAKFEEEAEQTIEYLEKRKIEAASLLQIIANIGVTGKYKETANENQKSANRFRIVALIFMSIMSIAGSVIVWLAVTNGFDWQLTLFRLITTLIFGIPAFYAAKESTRHRLMEIRSRKMELELASIDPYLEKLPEERRQELKATLAERFFGQPEVESQGNTDIVTKTDLFSALKDFVQMILRK